MAGRELSGLPVVPCRSRAPCARLSDGARAITAGAGHHGRAALARYAVLHMERCITAVVDVEGACNRIEAMRLRFDKSVVAYYLSVVAICHETTCACLVPSLAAPYVARPQCLAPAHA